MDTLSTSASAIGQPIGTTAHICRVDQQASFNQSRGAELFPPPTHGPAPHRSRLTAAAASLTLATLALLTWTAAPAQAAPAPQSAPAAVTTDAAVTAHAAASARPANAAPTDPSECDGTHPWPFGKSRAAP